MAKYVASNKLTLQDPRELSELFQRDDSAFEAELTRILLK
jgi:hypothetical protein